MSSAHVPRISLKLPQVIQQSESHCGPASLQILYSNFQKDISQDDITRAARISSTVRAKGSRPNQLANAVKKISPDLSFWFKQEGTVEDLALLVNKYKLPVAVNWQGLFYDQIEDEPVSNRLDKGHYSVVVGINLKKNSIMIQDTYRHFSKKPRVFALDWFVARWKDMVKDKSKMTGKFRTIKTKQFFYILVDKKTIFPKELGLLPPNKLNILVVKKKKV